MTSQPQRALRRTALLTMCVCLVPSRHHSVASALPESQTSSQPNQTKLSAAKGAVLLIDTDDTCRLFIDDADKGIVTPAQSQKFTVGLGQHIVKCTIESIPDLVWRKVLEVKDSSQVAAAISLKALHIQYDQAVAKAKTQKTEAEATAQKQLNEAEAEERARKAADAQALQKFFDVVKGEWKEELNTNGRTPAPHDWVMTLTLKQIENDGIRVIFLMQPAQPSPSYGFVVQGVFRPTSSTMLVNEGHYDSILCKGTGLSPGAATDANGWGACRFTINRSEIKFVTAKKVELNLGDHIRTFTR